MNTRPELETFIKEMESVLRENDHKSYKDASLEYMIIKLSEEVGEIAKGFNRGISPEEVRKECIDTANVAMMLWDLLGECGGK